MVVTRSSIRNLMLVASKQMLQSHTIAPLVSADNIILFNLILIKIICGSRVRM